MLLKDVICLLDTQISLQRVIRKKFEKCPLYVAMVTILRDTIGLNITKESHESDVRSLSRNKFINLFIVVQQVKMQKIVGINPSFSSCQLFSQTSCTHGFYFKNIFFFEKREINACLKINVE